MATVGECPELDAAAQWWADHLGSREQDAGDDTINLMAQALHCAPQPTDDQKRRFIEAFKAAWIACDYPWNPDDPGRASALRTVGVDYGPDSVLAGAAKAADYPITNGSFPIKTVMWINPGEVKVSCGYGAAPERVYRKDTP